MAEFIRRDSFLRADLFRERVTVPNDKEDVGCAYCGGIKYRKGRKGIPSMYLYQYYWHLDNMQVKKESELFCSGVCRIDFMKL